MQTLEVKKKPSPVFFRKPNYLAHNFSPIQHFNKNENYSATNSNRIQTKLKIGQPHDKYEQEADRVSDQVMRMSDNETLQTKYSIFPIQRECTECDEDEEINIQRKRNSGEVSSNALSLVDGVIHSPGKSLDIETRKYMEPRFGHDFSKVKIHDDKKSAESAESINALAYTIGNNIVFNKGKYTPNTNSGKRLLGHELTHTVQQEQMINKDAQMFIQRTTIGEILDGFFSPFSSETLWDMDENDNYTEIVRSWQPVIDGLNSIKQNIASDCATWSTTHTSTPGWEPEMNAIPDSQAYRHLVRSPPGTDPDTCRNAFIIYQGSRLTSPIFPIQTNDLYTCSIGSFSLAVTVDSIDCSNRTADINVWMYNVMSEHSFGKFAQYFPISGMKNQYMWWNWNETITWESSGGVTTQPEAEKENSWIGE